MRATGIVRRIDDLGRVVIPKEMRRAMNINEGDPLEIFTTSDGCVVFQKYVEGNDQMPDIFKDNEPAAEPVQPTAKTESRKNIILSDNGANEDYPLRLTDDQIKLLDYFIQEYVIDGSYEIIENHTFKEI